jgi:hypothetical protein
MAKPKKYLIEDNYYTMDEIQARCPHLTRTNAGKRLNCYAPTWAKLEAPLISGAEARARGRKVVAQTYKEIFPCW